MQLFCTKTLNRFVSWSKLFPLETIGYLANDESTTEPYQKNKGFQLNYYNVNSEH